MVSEAYGPNGNERNQTCDKWIADCHRRDEQSNISDYRDNHFNSILRGAAELIFHFKDLLQVENYLDVMNKKIQSIVLDLKDTRIITFVQALAIIYFKITEPYWRMIQSKQISYDRLPAYIQFLAKSVSKAIYHPETLSNDNVVFVKDYKPDITSPLYDASTTVYYPDRSELLLTALSCAATGIRETIGNQLTDFLKD